MKQYTYQEMKLISSVQLYVVIIIIIIIIMFTCVTFFGFMLSSGKQIHFCNELDNFVLPMNLS